MIITLVAVTVIVCALVLLIQACGRTRAVFLLHSATYQHEDIGNQGPAIFVGLKRETTNLVDEGGASDIYKTPNADDHHASKASEVVSRRSATWTNLLDECRNIERESRDWERLAWRVEHESNQPEIQEDVTLTVGVQRNRSRPSKWSSNAAQSTFAVISMHHLIELAAFLGLHWVRFDRDKRYRAIGNGYILTGAREQGTRVMFRLERYKISFPAKRVVPAPEIRQLCFGVVPTFYSVPGLDETDPVPLNTPRSLEILRLGTREKVIQTLRTIGCDEPSIQAYLEEEKNMLLFPVVFTMLGMLARTLHLKDRCFTYLPNPTNSRWNELCFSRRRLLSSFCSVVREEGAVLSQTELQITTELGEICDAASHLDRELPQCQDDGPAPLHQNALHSALDKLDITLKAYHKPLVLHVLRSHLEETLHAAVRLDGEATEEQGSYCDLAFVSRDSLECEIMDRYFDMIHRRVVDREPGSSKQLGGRTERNIIWCALVFRMICWLLLHNFDKDDVLVPDYELHRSKALVYVGALPEEDDWYNVAD